MRVAIRISSKSALNARAKRFLDDHSMVAGTRRCMIDACFCDHAYKICTLTRGKGSSTVHIFCSLSRPTSLTHPVNAVGTPIHTCNLFQSTHILSVRRVRPRNSSELRLPLISIHQQLLLVIQQLLSRLGRILGIWTLHNCIHRAALLTEPAVDALRHVDVVASGASGAVRALLGFNRDGLCGTNGFAEFAGDASFFACGVAAQSVLASEARGDGAFFEGVVDRISIASSQFLS